jgi:hypothetical protein
MASNAQTQNHKQPAGAQANPVAMFHCVTLVGKEFRNGEERASHHVGKDSSGGRWWSAACHCPLTILAITGSRD